jgi:hypothetical protein
MGIYQSIQEEFRDNVDLDPSDLATQEKVSVAIKGLSQLKQFDVAVMTGGKQADPNWNVTLEQNPMPAPADYERKR